MFYKFKLLESKEEQNFIMELERKEKGIDRESEFPFPIHRVRLLKCNEIHISIHAKGGKHELEKFASEILNTSKYFESKLKSFEKDGIKVKSFFIFDEEIPSDLKKFLKRLKKYLVITYQKYLPEDIILNFIRNCENDRLKLVKANFEKLKELWEGLQPNTPNNRAKIKRLVNLLKSLEGERCYSHLLEKLIDSCDCNNILSFFPRELQEFVRIIKVCGTSSS